MKKQEFQELEKRLAAIAALTGTDCIWKLSRHSILEPAMSRENTRHERPFCMAVKRENEQACLHQDLVIPAGLLPERKNGFLMHCHAGAEVFLIPVRREERLLGSVVCGPFRLGSECRYPEYAGLPLWRPEFAAALETAAETMLAPLIRDLYRLRPDLLPGLAEDPRILEVLEYMQSHYAEKITLETAAHQVFLSASRLSHLFRESCRIDFSSYLLKLRILAARELLSGTELAIGEIAAQCGFSGQHHFAVMFRRQTGMTASVYRRRRKRVRT